MISKFKLLVIGVLVVATAGVALACGDKDAKTSATASLAAASGGESGGCSYKAEKAALASKDGCASKASKSASATYASTAGGDHCGMKSMKGAKSAVAGNQCTYGENTVAINGACPTANEVDLAFAVKGAVCKDTGASVASTIKSLPGVAAVCVDYENHMAYVCCEGKTTNAKAIQTALKKAGYKEVKMAGKGQKFCGKAHGKDEV